MKYNVGDKVRIKSLDWYKKTLRIPSKLSWIDKANGFFEGIRCGSRVFTDAMCKFCGKVMTIQKVGMTFYLMEEDKIEYEFTDEMIEGLVEEETYDFLKTDIFEADKPYPLKPKVEDFLDMFNDTITLSEGFVFRDQDGNIINATKIILEKKKSKYPNTPKECCEVLNTEETYLGIGGHKGKLLQKFQKLLICRDAYWKIAGEEMGLGKPWEPDWTIDTEKYVIYPYQYLYLIGVENYRNTLLAFPTKEMRDAFYENFEEDIEFVKELL